MSKEPRYLITTADERTWKFDRPVIFLGEWCRRYDRRQVWSKMDAAVAEPYGLGQAQKDLDEARVRELESRLFPRLCDALNRHHRRAYGERFWKIVLGHWLRTYMSTMFNRFRTLQSCFERHEISGTMTIPVGSYGLATPDSYSATLAANDDAWNHALDCRILLRLGKLGCPADVLHARAEGRFMRPQVASSVSLRRRFLRLGRRTASAVAARLMRDGDAMIIGSYLPLVQELQLQAALGQVPQIWRPQPLETLQAPDTASRAQLAGSMKSGSSDPLEEFVHDMLFELLPVCYLEGFAGLSQAVSRLNWPKHPKFIFTSNNFDSDEIFKLWTAMQTESGTPYFAGQHGGNYGSRRIPHRSVEEETSDKFLTWGWTDGMPQHKPAFVLTTAGKGGRRREHGTGGILLVIECLNHRIPAWDDAAEFARRWADKLAFITLLASDVRRSLTARLHPSFRHMTWSDVERLREFDPDLRLDIGERPIGEAIAGSRLIAFSYDSSGFYECLSQNIPTVGFWRTGLDFLRESAKPLFRVLVDAGIFHVTPEAAARKVNEISADVSGWWARPEVQDAREEFCGRFARTTRKPVATLKSILLSEWKNR